MKNLIIAACVAVIAIGGSVSVFAVSDPVVDVRVWQSVTDESLLYVSTKPAGGSWTTHNTALDMSEISASGRFRQSNFITVDADGSVTVAGSTPSADTNSSDASSTTTTHPTLGTQTSAGYWTIDEETDPITDARIVWATTIASAVVTKDWGYSTYDNPYIGIRCTGSTLEAFVRFDTFIAGQIGNDRVPVLYRVDSQASVREQWSESTNSVAIFAPQPATFVRALLTGSQLVVRATSFDSEVLTLTVRVTGLADVLGNLPCYRPSSG